jgi:2,3-bisphosphoglycerate-independent phosphoglycerate mutase
MPRALLAILDGFGIAENKSVSAIDLANTPFFDSIVEKWPHSQLIASGEAVGLPEGQFGNSEVGHLNIGAGRIVWQELSRINKAIREGDFFTNEVLLDAVKAAKEKGYIHIMGLFSDGGVHSHNNHLFALLELCKKHEVPKVFVHAFTDGRDTGPQSGIEYAKAFLSKAREIGIGEIATIIGRYYAMDRDKRWERVTKAYEALVNGVGKTNTTVEDTFLQTYADSVTDEFILPSIISSDPDSRIKKGDTVIFYNIRGDRARQITTVLTDPSFSEFPVGENLELNYITFTQYDATFERPIVAYPPVNLNNTLGQVVAAHGLKQVRIAETEKYPHVTYFFNGGIETPNEGEERIMVSSPKVATYDLQPEMSAPEVADKLCEALASEKFSLAILNFANPDMVGHTGIMEAAIKAVETVDTQLKRVVTTALEHDYKVIIIADHGNADCMSQPDGSPHTAHTTVPVPFILIDPENNPSSVKNGILADVAPSLLKLLNIEQPSEMTGKALF